MIYTADGKWIPYEEPKSGIMGDVDLNGRVNIFDVTVIQRAGIEMKTLSDWQQTLGDVNGDGRVSILDATCVQRYIAEFTDNYGTTGNTVTG